MYVEEQIPFAWNEEKFPRILVAFGPYSKLNQFH